MHTPGQAGELCSAEASRKFYKNAFKLPHVSRFLAASSPITEQINNTLYEKLRFTSDYDLGARRRLHTQNHERRRRRYFPRSRCRRRNNQRRGPLDTRQGDEVNPQPTAINVQISQDPTFVTGLTTLPAGTAGSPTDYIVKSNVGGLEPGTVYYYRFQTTNASVTSNVGKFKTAPNPTANAPVHFGFSGDCDGLIRPYALASQVPAKNLDFFMFDGDTEYEPQGFTPRL